MTFGDLETDSDSPGNSDAPYAYLYKKTEHILSGDLWSSCEYGECSTDSILLAMLACIPSATTWNTWNSNHLFCGCLLTFWNVRIICLVEEPTWVDLDQYQQPSSFFKAEFIWNICKSNDTFLVLLMGLYLIVWLEIRHWIPCVVNVRKKIILFNTYAEVTSNI